MALSPPKTKHPDPIVEHWLNNDLDPSTSVSVLKQLELSSSPKAAAILGMLEASLGLRSIEEAEAQADAALHKKSNIDLHLLLLLSWHRFHVFKGTISLRVEVITDQFLSLLSEKTPAEFHAWANYMLVYLKEVRGDLVAVEELLARVPEPLTPESAHYNKLQLLKAISYFEYGKGVISEEILRDHSIELTDVFAKRLLFGRFINCATTGDLTLSRELLPQVMQSSAAERAFQRIKIEIASHLTLLMSEEEKLPLLEYQSETQTNSQVPLWVRSTRALLKSDPEDALKWARRYVARETALRRTCLFDDFSLIRAELSMRQCDAAKRLIDTRREIGSIHYMDDFFLARVNLAMGKTDLAAKHFARVLKSADEFKAHGCLNFEIRLSSELSANDIIDLTRRATRILDVDRTVPEPVKIAKNTTEQRRGTDRLIHASKEIDSILTCIRDFAKHTIPVLITGETGTGKELIAQAIHESGATADKPFIAVNCGAISEGLIESELFGHRRGAFTGAQNTRMGLFREAKDGTIFLDEIGEISPRLQVALLRILESNEVRPIGSSERYNITCRITAATNASLDQLVAKGKFRADLYFRLKRLQIEIPPLRNRPADIRALAEYFVNQGRAPGEHAHLASDLIEYLKNHDWPGNVRELRNTIERMRILNSDKLYYKLCDLETLENAQSPITTENPNREQDVSTESIESQRLKNTVSSTTAGKYVERVPMRSLEQVRDYLNGATSPRRRLNWLRRVFEEFGELRVSEAVEILGVSRVTATRYLKLLCEEGLIEKMKPTASSRSHFYALKIQANISEND